MNLLQLIFQNNLTKFIFGLFIFLFFSLNAQSEIPENYQIKTSLKNCQGNNFVNWDNCYGEFKFPRIQYKGEWMKGSMHGKGILREAWGDIYVGDFKNNLADGFGRQDFYRNGVYKGYFEGFVSNDEMNGKGKWVEIDYFDYEGEFKNHNFHGLGKIKWFEDGKIATYEGNFKDGVLNGQGKYKYIDGGLYVGNFSNGYRSGEGEMTYENGDKYVGAWKLDYRDGFGKYEWSNGDVYVGHYLNDTEQGAGMFKKHDQYFYEGGFVDGDFHGLGNIQWIDGDRFIGDFVNGLRTGKGTYIFTTGTEYKGDFLKNEFSGSGKIKYADGSLYDGGVLNGLEHGFGKLIYENGNIYEGQFDEGYLHGQGKMVYANGDIYEGLWEDGNEAEDKKTLAKFSTNEKYYALIIGNNDYENLSDLDNAVNDAVDLEKVLKEKYGFETSLLLNANKDKTLDAIIEFTDNAKENDNLLIFYAGHGQLVKKQKRGYWLPTDAGEKKDSKWLSNNIIKDEILSSDAGQILLIIDSCFSGSLTRSSGDNKSVEKLKQSTIDRLLDKKTRLVITSGGNEDVADGVGGSKNSVFAEPLIKILKNNNDVIRSYELFKSIQSYVIDNAAQTPNHSTIHGTGHDGGEFLFFPIS